MRNFIFIVFVLMGCSDGFIYPKESYPIEVDEYITEFKSEAKIRGYSFDFNGLTIVVSKSIPVVIDHPEYEAYYQPLDHTIYIDSDGYNWNEMRRELVHHELGHAILKRGHNFERLPNGDQKSLMGCPCSNTNNGWSEAGRENKRKYYFDELFNPSTVYVE